MGALNRQFSVLGLILALGAVVSVTMRLRNSETPLRYPGVTQFVLAVIIGVVSSSALDRFWSMQWRIFVGVVVFSFGWLFWDKTMVPLLVGILLLGPWSSALKGQD